MPHKIVDTNVPLTAAGENNDASDVCVLECVRTLDAVIRGEVTLLMDEAGEILSEYRSNMYPDPNPSAGLASHFLMHLIYNLGDSSNVHILSIPKDSSGQFEDYPDKDGSWTADDPRCITFDPDDKKWIALALRFKKDTGNDAPIVNAADRCWLAFESCLESAGVRLEVLCRDERQANI